MTDAPYGLARRAAWTAPAGLHGYRWSPPQPRARVLLQHGYGEHAGRYVERYSRLVPSLLGQRIEVFAFDLAGHGRSAGVRGVTHVGRMVEAHLEARRDLSRSVLPLFVFGHSLGGLITASSAAREPDGLAGVILTGPALPPPTGTLARASARLLSAILPGRAVSPLGNPEGVSRIEEEVSAYLADPLNFQRPLPARLGATALSVASDLWPRLGEWTAPTLVIHGSADTYTSPEGSRRLVTGIASPDKLLHLVEDGRHEPLNDIGREATLAIILEWISRRLHAAGARPEATS